MDEIEKLKKLLNHWIEHNKEHINNYKRWSDKALELNKKELSEILERVSEETGKINRLFEKAIEKID